jgi:hypothetical protein
MSPRFSIVQYVPDPVTDERINIGVVVVDESDRVQGRFLRDWRRVREFGGTDVKFLQAFAREIEDLASSQPHLLIDPLALTRDVLDAAPERWHNALQLTPFRASTLDADALLEQIGGRFLKERVPRARGRDRRAAASIAANQLMEAVRGEGARRPERYVQRNVEIEGKHDDHHLDVALANGTVRLGALGLSFESRTPNDLQREIRATAWTLDDVAGASDIPLAVVVLPPKSRSKNYEHATDLFTDLGAEVVPEDEVADWARDVARDIPVVHRKTR